ncbi:Histone-lysine N-methyltransferase SUVR5 [Camellia lanceoleosa]|uniref:Histone-lysine N-methyltransferase SUVR5 n=1 Tax=Camellia lanceoleosa TaxID=1840588 RepID=A0ACC0IY52_9ERIC|nr:Histone-lysine N-methyltransferase SUVR5 [Camellia lanceoleosa]
MYGFVVGVDIVKKGIEPNVTAVKGKALSETARSVMVWKEFAMEASRCKGYSDLGRMLLKLHNMVASISLLLSLSLEWNKEQTEEQGGAESPPVVANDPCAQSSEKKEDNPINESDVTFIASTKHSQLLTT